MVYINIYLCKLISTHLKKTQNKKNCLSHLKLRDWQKSAIIEILYTSDNTMQSAQSELSGDQKGVPQGSVLSLVFFILFTNYLTDWLQDTVLILTMK